MHRIRGKKTANYESGATDKRFTMLQVRQYWLIELSVNIYSIHWRLLLLSFPCTFSFYIMHTKEGHKMFLKRWKCLRLVHPIIWMSLESAGWSIMHRDGRKKIMQLNQHRKDEWCCVAITFFVDQLIVHIQWNNSFQSNSYRHCQEARMSGQRRGLRGKKFKFTNQ